MTLVSKDLDPFLKLVIGSERGSKLRTTLPLNLSLSLMGSSGSGTWTSSLSFRRRRLSLRSREKRSGVRKQGWVVPVDLPDVKWNNTDIWGSFLQTEVKVCGKSCSSDGVFGSPSSSVWFLFCCGHTHTNTYTHTRPLNSLPVLSVVYFPKDSFWLSFSKEIGDDSRKKKKKIVVEVDIDVEE